jgi:hypothetical protein
MQLRPDPQCPRPIRPHALARSANGVTDGSTDQFTPEALAEICPLAFRDLESLPARIFLDFNCPWTRESRDATYCRIDGWDERIRAFTEQVRSGM